MQQLIINVNDESKLDVLVSFFQSLNYMSVEKVEEDVFTEGQKKILDERQASDEEYIPWEIARKKLRNT